MAHGEGTTGNVVRRISEQWTARRARGAHERPAAPAPREDALLPASGSGPSCSLYAHGHRRAGDLPLRQASRVARERDGFIWVELVEPSESDIAAVAAEFDLPPLAVEDAVKAHQRPKLELYGDVVFVVLKPVRYVDSNEVVDIAEIALFLGEHFVVTVRHGSTNVLHHVRAELDSGQSDLLRHGPACVLYRAADLVVDGYEDAVIDITEDLDEIESQVFGWGDEDHTERIYKLKRELTEFRRAALPLAPPLRQLAEDQVRLVGTGITHYFRDVHDHVLRAADAIEGHDRLLSDVLQAHLARVGVRQNSIAVRQNEDMRKISAWAAIALVPTAIAGIYGMNFDNMPELRWQYGYYVVVGAILVACVVLHRLFRRNGWL
jgi:magnesium transporter